MIDTRALEPLLADYIGRQRWFAGERVSEVDVRWYEVVRDDEASLLWMLVDTITEPSGERAAYQLFVGGRAADPLPDFLNGKERVTIGELDDRVLYDALIDSELAIDVLAHVAPDEHVDVARPLVVEQSNSSVIFDERLILKVFRRIHPGANPDVEVNQRLHEVGFAHVVPEVATLRRDDGDLAVVRQYFVGALDGWHLAHTSLRDMLASRMPPEECGGDFAPDAARLGEVTAQLHLAMAEAFGTEPGDVKEWVAGFHAQLERVDPLLGDGAVDAVFDNAALVGDPGASIRVHGDLHLAQVVQTDSGWYVLDFEGEPARPLDERMRPTSPLKDVAGMLRSFHYAARTAVAEWGHDVDAELSRLADAWERRSVDAFVAAYQAVDGIDALLPPDDDDRKALLAALELDKAVYEVGYERDHRPDWMAIPLVAIERILSREQ